MQVGPLAVGTLAEWTPNAGATILWQPSAVALEAAADAPLSDVPVSYMQAQHIRGYVDQKDKGLDYSRLMIVSCDAPGHCDVRAMSYVINQHLRRHDTYRSRFEMLEDGSLVRRTIADVADIQFVPKRHGVLTLEQARELVVSTPDPLQWDCFRYGIVQGDDHFTFYFSIDHVHTDALLMGLVLVEIHLMYAALVSGAPPIPLADAGSYDDYCVKQAEFTSALTLESPEVKDWIKFAQANDGTLPCFPLPLGDPSVPCGGEMLTVRLMDKHQSERFESACLSAGARVIGGVIACAALAEHEAVVAHVESNASTHELRPRKYGFHPFESTT